MITELTKEQEAMIPVYLEKYLKAGRNTEPLDQEKAIACADFFYVDVLKAAKPNEYVFLDSPMAVFKEVAKRLDIKVEYISESRSILWSSYYFHYGYILNELMPEKKNTDYGIMLDKYNEHIVNIFTIYMYENVCFFVNRPSEININNEGRPHCTTGHAMLFRDGTGFSALNGIRVPREIATMRPENVTKEMILKETNADIRREIVRKLSAEQLVSVLDAKVVDKMGDYELLVLDIGDGRNRPFLKMVNPSLGIVHVEGVRPEIKTVEEALRYRNGLESYTAPLALS